MRDLFVLDDTGAPGNNSQSLMLRSDRSAYMAVLIRAQIRHELSQKIRDMLNRYSHLGIKEFHFTDLLNRRKEYKKLDALGVQQIFSEFVDILKEYQLPLFFQSMTNESYAESGLNDDGKLSLEEKVIYFIVLRIVKYTVEVEALKNFEIICDEGLAKHGEERYYKELSRLTDIPAIKFMSSDSNPLLQVADFYAFVLNRHQMLAIKPKRSDFDKWFISVTGQVFDSQFKSGFGPFLIGDNDGAKTYDSVILEHFKRTGSYRYWKEHNEKRRKPKG